MVLSMDQWSRIENLWPEIRNPIDTEKPKKRNHVCPSMTGEFSYGPWYWRIKRNIPLLWIIQSETLGRSATHLRAGILGLAMYDAYGCSEPRPVRIGRDDAEMMGLRPKNLFRYFRDLETHGLIYLETPPRSKARIIPRDPWNRKAIGRWKTPRNLWWPALSHIATRLESPALMVYLFLSVHTKSHSHQVQFDATLPGWTKTRREYERGLSALLGDGLIYKIEPRHFHVPTLFGPHPQIEITPSWSSENPMISRLKGLEND
jgi:hypothetical protein